MGQPLLVMVGKRPLHEQGQQQPQDLLEGLPVGAGAVLVEGERIAQQGPERDRHRGYCCNG
jgi:hypothetical protein